MSRRWLWWLAGLAAITALVIAEIATSGSGTSSAQRKAAPALPTQVLVEPQVTLASLRGTPTLVNFWASWCTPCRQESPELNRFAKEMKGRVNVVGVDWNDTTSNAESFIAELGLTYPILRDGSSEVGASYGITGLPTTFVLDSRGRIAETLRGPQTESSLRAALKGVT